MPDTENEARNSRHSPYPHAGNRPKGAVHLLDVFGSAEAVFSASADELIEKARLRPELARAILQKKAFADAEREVKHCRKHGIEIIASTDAQYPALLRETADYPHVLYVLGSPEALGKTTLTMVGTRRMTPYGQQMADRLIGELADRVADLAADAGRYHRLYCRLLMELYGAYEKKELLAAVCAMLIRGEDVSAQAFSWYGKGMDAGLASPGFTSITWRPCRMITAVCSPRKCFCTFPMPRTWTGR